MVSLKARRCLERSSSIPRADRFRRGSSPSSMSGKTAVAGSPHCASGSHGLSRPLGCPSVISNPAPPTRTSHAMPGSRRYPGERRFSGSRTGNARARVLWASQHWRPECFWSAQVRMAGRGTLYPMGASSSRPHQQRRQRPGSPPDLQPGFGMGRVVITPRPAVFTKTVQFPITG